MQYLICGATIKLISIISLLIINVILTSYLSKNEVGLYYLVTSLSIFLSMIARMGHRQVLVRYISEGLFSKNYKLVSDSLGSAYCIIIFSLIFILLCIQAVDSLHLISFDYKINLNYVFLLTVFFSLETPLVEYFRSFRSGLIAVFFDNCAIYIFFASSLFVFKNVLEFDTVIILFITSGLVVFILQLFVAKFKFNFKISYNYDLFSEFFSASLVLAFVNILMFVQNSCGIWILGLLKDSSYSSDYGIALKMMAVVSLPFVFINSIIQPAIVRLLNDREYKNLETYIRSSASFVFYVSLVLILFILIFGDHIFTYLFGNQYNSVYSLTIIFSLANIINVFSGSNGVLLSFMKKQIVLLYIMILSFMLNILISFCLVDNYGSIGCALGYFAGVLCFNFIAVIYIKIKYDIWTLASLNLFDGFRFFKKFRY